MDKQQQQQTSSKTALVLGASGGVGGEVARQLRDAGWAVRALQRGLEQPQVQRDGMTWLRGDAMNAADVLAAAQGCGVIVHAVNPPGYQRWAELVLPMVDNTIAAARAVGATIALPGTVYNFGPDALAQPLIGEDAPQRPVTRKGAIRVEMERRLQQASGDGARVLILRAGDFFGPRTGNSWFAQGMVKPGKPVRSVALPSAPGVGHQWAYLPDLARTMVALLSRRAELPAFARFHFEGHWDADGRQLGQAVQRVVASRSGGAAPKLTALPWWLLKLASPFVPVFREMQEMRYLWRQPVRMDGQRLAAFLGEVPHTRLDEAVAATLEGIGCLAASSQTDTAVLNPSW
ncbi:NAD(P)H-binding protein [Ideonella azotifigens]|uniref:NAD(P)H-binding protein n=1 Tax=Ideonella azotifigens TaxID=513160 RepID=A0ABN1JZ46_9BURK|nr:NAD-dependent epimerase/dehydratase family protein [Ideonella azotifigens]MCD2342750.1 NAD(P)H-binding protein [Ideonella azotifigens]